VYESGNILSALCVRLTSVWWVDQLEGHYTEQKKKRDRQTYWGL